MVLLFWIGARWREDDRRGGRGSRGAAGARSRRPAIAARAWRRSWCAGRDRGLAARLRLLERSDVAVATPTRCVRLPGLEGGSPPGAAVRLAARFAGAARGAAQTFTRRTANASACTLPSIAVQSAGAKAITSHQCSSCSTTNKMWTRVGEGAAEADVGGHQVNVRTAIVAGDGQRLACGSGTGSMAAPTSSDLVGQAMTALARLEMVAATPSAWVDRLHAAPRAATSECASGIASSFADVDAASHRQATLAQTSGAAMTMPDRDDPAR